MKRTFHFARKQRQLNFRLKQLKSLIASSSTMASIQKLAAEILFLKSELPMFNYKSYKTLLSIGLISCSLNTSFAQNNFQPNVEQYFNLLENERNKFTAGYLYKFIDADGDGDLDCFIELEGNKLNQYSEYEKNNELYYQENISNGTISFADAVPFANLDYSYENYVADLDKDGDIDIYQQGFKYYGPYDYVPGIYIYENTSNLPNVFNVVDTSFIPILIGPYYDYPLFHLLFSDIDNDGDQDLLCARYYSLYGYDPPTLDFVYFENNGTNALDPFETGIYNPFNLSAVATKLITQIEANGIGLHRYDLKDIDFDGDIDFTFQTTIQESIVEFDTILYELHYFENTGDNTVSFSDSSTLIYNDPLIGYSSLSNGVKYLISIPTFVDIDEDGDLDILSNLFHFENVDFGYYSSSIDYFTNTIYFSENTYNPTLNNLVKNNLSFELLGNPTHDKAIINFRNDSHHQTDLKIYSTSGVLVEHLKTYESNLIINRKNMASGIYFFTISIEEISATGKLVFTN